MEEPGLDLERDVGERGVAGRRIEAAGPWRYGSGRSGRARHAALDLQRGPEQQQPRGPSDAPCEGGPLAPARERQECEQEKQR